MGRRATAVREIPDFGQALAQLRRQHGLTLLGLAERSGVQPAHISGIENGRKPQPGWLVMCRLADALGVSIVAFRGPEKKVHDGIH